MVGRVSSLVSNENLVVGNRTSQMIIYTADYLCLFHSSKMSFIMTNETTGILKQHFVWVIKILTNTS